jgi:hypothetical protein
MGRAWAWLFSLLVGSAAGVYIGLMIADSAL